MRILIVDDTREILEGIQLCLTELGNHEVIVADNARCGLRMAAKSKPDVILVDYRMPDLSGTRFIEIIKFFEDTKMAKAILFSASHFVESKADAFLSKISGIDEILNTINKVMGLTE